MLFFRKIKEVVTSSTTNPNLSKNRVVSSRTFGDSIAGKLPKTTLDIFAMDVDFSCDAWVGSPVPVDGTNKRVAWHGVRTPPASVLAGLRMVHTLKRPNPAWQRTKQGRMLPGS